MRNCAEMTIIDRRNYNIMQKKKTSRGYYLGKDIDDKSYYLALPQYDCGWYWGFGYIQTKDSHQHASGDFIATNSAGSDHKYNSDTNIFTGDFLTIKTFTKEEGWLLRELIQQFYTFRKMADLYHIGGAHVTTDKLGKQWQNQKKSDHINQKILPIIFEQIDAILTPVTE